MVMDLRNLFPWFQPGAGSADAGTPPTGSDAVPEVRFTAARDAAVQSYRNRYGRPPSAAELEEMTPQYLTPADRAVYERERAARRPVLARGFPTPPRMTLPPPIPLADSLTSSTNAGRSIVDDARSYGDASLKTLGAMGRSRAWHQPSVLSCSG